jgi:hypothetical protein
MSQPLTVPRNVALSEWVEQARADPIRYRERQVTEILLHSIGITPQLRDTLVLKGGILMSLAHGSYRQTGDVDFTAITEPEPYASLLRETLNQALPRAAVDIGYVDLVCAVQRFHYKPRPEGFADFATPALQLTIGYAERGGRAEEQLKLGKSPRVLQVDISFRERVVYPTELVIEEPEVTIQAYTIEEIIAEKFRALLQQPLRNRGRRQDVFDIDWLIDRYRPDAATKATIFEALLAKAADRSISPEALSLDVPEVKDRAKAEWNTLRLEIGNRLPDFEETFARVSKFYASLPWDGRRVPPTN